MFELFCHHFLCELVPQVGKIGGVASDNSNVARVALEGWLVTIWIGFLEKDYLRGNLVATSSECKVVDFGSVGPFQEGGTWRGELRSWRGLEDWTVVGFLFAVDGDCGRHTRLGLEERVQLEARRWFWTASNHCCDPWSSV